MTTACPRSQPLENSDGVDMKPAGLCILLLAFQCVPGKANASVTVLLEEPYSYDGAPAGTGQTAVYLTRVCAAPDVTSEGRNG